MVENLLSRIRWDSELLSTAENAAARENWHGERCRFYDGFGMMSTEVKRRPRCAISWQRLKSQPRTRKLETYFSSLKILSMRTHFSPGFASGSAC